MLLRPLTRVASLFTTPHAPADFLRLVNPLASSRQLRAVVTSVTRETADSATIRFRPGRGWHVHEAGQWARIGVEIDGVRQWRSYSLSTPSGADPAVTVTAIGSVSTALVRHTKVGDVLFLAPPEGDFLLPEHPRPLLMLTAGSGVTPVMAMIRTLVRRRRDADVVLLHSARTPAECLFLGELRELADEFPGFRFVPWFTGGGRRLDLADPTDLDALCADWRGRAAYACGPTDFVDAAQMLWEREGGELKVERFSVPVPVDGGEGGRVSFARSDKEVDASGGTTLLAAGEEAGVLMRSGCRMGICHACLTPLIEGRVRDTRTGEVHGEPGHLIQTCISTAAGAVCLDA